MVSVDFTISQSPTLYIIPVHSESPGKWQAFCVSSTTLLPVVTKIHHSPFSEEDEELSSNQPPFCVIHTPSAPLKHNLL